MKSAIAFAFLVSGVGLLAGGLQASRPAPSAPPAATRPSSEHHVEVRVRGCVLGSTITEVAPARADQKAEPPVRRWRLLLTPKLRKEVKALGRRQIEVTGLADTREIERSAEANSRKAGRGGLRPRAAAAASGSPFVPPPPTPMPRLEVAAVTATSDTCR